jgi:hypothetical protein
LGQHQRALVACKAPSSRRRLGIPKNVGRGVIEGSEGEEGIVLPVVGKSVDRPGLFLFYVLFAFSFSKLTGGWQKLDEHAVCSCPAADI